MGKLGKHRGTQKANRRAMKTPIEVLHETQGDLYRGSDIWKLTEDQIEYTIKEYADERVLDVLKWIWDNKYETLLGDHNKIYEKYKNTIGEGSI